MRPPARWQGRSSGRVPGRVALVALLLGAAGAPAAAAAQGAGSAATTVLRLAPGPRGLALGQALVAVDDPMALEHNPAARGEGGVAVSYQALPVDVVAGAGAVRLPLGRLSLGLSVRFVDYGEIDVIEPDPSLPVGTPTGRRASGGEVTGLLGASARLGRLRLGAAARWLRMDIAGLDDQAAAVDAGVALDATDWLVLGAAVQNLGGDVEAGRAAPLPAVVRGGVAVRRQLGPLTGLLAAEGRRRESRTGLGLGLELGGGGERVRAVGRLGFETRPDPGDAYSRFVFGGGVRIDRFSVDLAYRALGPLGSTRQVGLAYRF